MNKTIEEVNLGFVEAFGQETFNEFETLTQLEPFVEMVAADLEVEPLSLAVEDIEKILSYSIFLRQDMESSSQKDALRTVRKLSNVSFMK